jgi:hypothetical protein
VQSIRNMAYQDADAVDITGGTIDGVPIGNAVPAAGRFTTLKANDPISGQDDGCRESVPVLHDGYQEV